MWNILWKLMNSMKKKIKGLCNFAQCIKKLKNKCYVNLEIINKYFLWINKQNVLLITNKNRIYSPTATKKVKQINKKY